AWTACTNACARSGRDTPPMLPRGRSPPGPATSTPCGGPAPSSMPPARRWPARPWTWPPKAFAPATTPWARSPAGLRRTIYWVTFFPASASASSERRIQRAGELTNPLYYRVLGKCTNRTSRGSIDVLVTVHVTACARSATGTPAPGAGVLLVVAVSACGKKEEAAQPGPAAEPAAATQPAKAPPKAVSDEVAALSADDLRKKASEAYQDSRLYAPAGDNAMEYYLALRDKLPGDPGVSSALTDLRPMPVIATEQSRDRGDFEEAQRLYALIEKADKDHPSL